MAVKHGRHLPRDKIKRFMSRTDERKKRKQLNGAPPSIEWEFRRHFLMPFGPRIGNSLFGAFINIICALLPPFIARQSQKKRN